MPGFGSLHSSTCAIHRLGSLQCASHSSPHQRNSWVSKSRPFALVKSDTPPSTFVV